MATTFDPADVEDLGDRLRQVNADLARRYPGEHEGRQPVHTVYGGAHLFRRDTAGRLGRLALRALDAHAPDPSTFADVVGAPAHLADDLYARVRGKLDREPVEDFRIDFEDGYGTRPDDEEDGHAGQAAREVAAGLAEQTLPPYVGIRVKPFTEELRHRSFRTVDTFVSTLAEATGGRVPPGFVVTLPKVRAPGEAAVLDEVVGRLEDRLGLAPGAVRTELMIEVTQAIVDDEGRLNVRRLVDAAGSRCVAAHFGTYDYTASCTITAEHQHMTHPACDFAKHVMQVGLGGTGTWLSDGATNIMPVGPYPEPSTPEEEADNRRAVHDAWRLHVAHVRHSLVHGYYQGWDLHPAQLPTRYGAVYTFFLEGLAAAGDRLRHFVDAAAKATLSGDVFDDAATGQGLLNFFLRAVNCGAVSQQEATEQTGLTADELASHSFPRILQARTATP